MTTPHTSPRTAVVPPMIGDVITHLREGYDFLGGEIAHAMALIDCGEPKMAYQVLQEALRVMDSELARH